MVDIVEMRKQFENERRKVDVDSLDISVRELVRMAAEETIILSPEYQRKFRWDTKIQSQLVESILIGLPVPSIFVAVNADGRWELVDGLQRMSTFLHFYGDERGTQSGQASLLKLCGKSEALQLNELEKLTAFNGATYKSLPLDIRSKFDTKFIRVISISDKSDFDVRFDTFERLNRGGVRLTEQEVRACVFRGKFSEGIRELARDTNFRSLLKLQKAHQEDGTHEELVLKVFAYKNNRDAFRGQVTQFLNDYMKSRVAQEFSEKEKTNFTDTCSHLSVALKGKPFLRSNVSVTPQNQFEAVAVALAEVLEEGKTPRGLSGMSKWLNDEELVASSTGATNTKSMLTQRINRAKKLIQGRASASATAKR